MCGNLPKAMRSEAKSKQNRSEWKKGAAFSSVCLLNPLAAPPSHQSTLRAFPNGVNICANSIKWICSYACDLHFVAEITLSHAHVVRLGLALGLRVKPRYSPIEWQLPQSTHSGGALLSKKYFSFYINFAFRINFYDFRAKLPLLSALSFLCCLLKM